MAAWGSRAFHGEAEEAPRPGSTSQPSSLSASEVAIVTYGAVVLGYQVT